MTPTAVPPRSLLEPGERGLSEVDTDMQAIGKAEDQIDRLFPNADKDRPAAKGKGDIGGAAQDAAANDGCATACKALASMQRSADHLCKIAGEGDGRCEDARTRVRGASARVRSVCPVCAAQAP